MASRKDKRSVLKHDDPKPGIVGRKGDFVATNATQRKWLTDATSVGEKKRSSRWQFKIGSVRRIATQRLLGVPRPYSCGQPNQGPQTRGKCCCEMQPSA